MLSLLGCWQWIKLANVLKKVNLILLPNRRSRGIEASPTETTFFGDDRDSGALAPPKRAVLKALKMSVIHVAFFILSWTPYTVIATWWILSSIWIVFMLWWFTSILSLASTKGDFIKQSLIFIPGTPSIVYSATAILQW